MNNLFIRRSIRRFDDTPVEDKKVEMLLKAAMQAPSAKNAQPWEFLVVRDAETRLAISQMSEFAGVARYAPVLIITLANLDFTTSGQWWAQDLSAATQNILLQAVEEGLGAVWLGFYPREERVSRVRAHFHLPESVVPFSVVAVGYSQRENRFIDRYQPERVHWEMW